VPKVLCFGSGEVEWGDKAGQFKTIVKTKCSSDNTADPARYWSYSGYWYTMLGKLLQI